MEPFSLCRSGLTGASPETAAPTQIVVIAVAGRALAQSAAKTGCRVRVLDAFADRDTRAVSEATCIATDHAIGLDPARLFAALDAPAQRPGGRILVTGSGFERTPELLERLAAYGRLCANDAQIVAALKQPELAAELLRALGWSVPETQRDVPGDRHGWLQKEIGGAGGNHVRSADCAPARSGAYYQRRMSGCPISVTFLADAEHAWVLGFNAQSFHAIGNAPFCYAGASTCRLAPELAAEVQARLNRLVRIAGLRGLNGLDFLLDGTSMVALEVNPRPTATFELYEEDFPEGLVAWHLRSFAGPVPEFGERLRHRPACARAYSVLYAERALQVPDDVAFPDWCRDLPMDGSWIGAGAPVLSVFAAGENKAAAQRRLEQRKREVRRMLLRWQVGPRAGDEGAWPGEDPNRGRDLRGQPA
ncbi:MAG TPA: ATP-grasp domain-containing protein [Burkholderiales bacterium]|nr:ATP-grasp domain-containing protein [Burkholderiales bacterium]